MENVKTLTARSLCDYECIFTLKFIKITAKTATVKAMNTTRRCKIYTNSQGAKYIFALGQYSMAPKFTL